ncbi:MAG: carbohydrate kinase family protein [Anaerolineae bacterium]|jgi:sugar/nucleoside kinase (ribokinase family)|nr:carbohydrate kinase family protein [Anaerolineae bacterium]MBT4309114.1 carbohydrate kinase family protein [Anaerolineae bacterium]MBT4460145.1 carbohydrate kinase family protein [Anaerolineae bacterium]MBT4843158.1 carbohydrate kinase family protein [Anaerolineae bacterium]MBT6059800.1 carbohydrate kinase family protein [Anaerolineae bacterium]
MSPTLLFAGRLNREYVLPVEGAPILDRAGGSPLYAAGAAAIWEKEIALLARVGEDYPNRWLRNFAEYGIDSKGVQVVPGSLDLRSFRAYSEARELSRANLVRHFADRELTFPKALLGYRPPEKREKFKTERHPATPLITEIPPEYLESKALHIAPLDFKSQGQLLTAFRAASAKIITLDPSPRYMGPNRRQDLQLFLDGLTAFVPSEEELRQLFWGETHDLWEMAEELGEFGCHFIIVKRGKEGQLLYDVNAKKRWELPAYASRVADPTGAGDAFCGGFLAGFQQSEDPLRAAAHGNVSASLSMEGSGPFYPTEVLPGLAQARLDAMLDMIREI